MDQYEIDVPNIFLDAALQFHKLGLNVSLIKPEIMRFKNGQIEETYKKPSVSLEILSKEKQTFEQLNSYKWEDACGIGIVLGFENLRALDIDGCHDNFVIESICELLGLPIDYEWVVRSGSQNGYHIYFFCEDHDFKIPEGKVKAFVPNGRYIDTFGHIELRWNGHMVAPGSKHVSGNTYKYVNALYLPQSKPKIVSLNKIKKVIDRFCLNVEEYYRQHENYSHYQYYIDDEYAFRDLKVSGGGITSFGIYKLPFYLFLDCETNGLPYSYEDPERNWQSWPEIVQIAYLVCDADGKRIKEDSAYIYPDNWCLSKEASEILNLTTEDLRKKGTSLRMVLKKLFDNYDFFDTSQFPFKYIIGHNIEYDIKCMKAIISRVNSLENFNWDTYNLQKLITKVPSICTMKTTVDYCALRGSKGNKYPKLSELYEKLFKEKISVQHDAMADVRSTAVCFWKLKDMQIIDKYI